MKAELAKESHNWESDRRKWVRTVLYLDTRKTTMQNLDGNQMQPTPTPYSNLPNL